MINLLSVSDKKYLKYTIPCFNSFNKNNSINFFLYYVGSNKLKLNNTTIYFDNKSLSCIKNINKKTINEDNEFLQYFPNKKILVSEKECYCNNMRFFFISNLLNSGVKNIVFTDADMICNKNIEFLPALCYKKDLGLQEYYVDAPGLVSTKGTVRYRTNFMYINNTAGTKILFSRVSAEIEKNYKFWGHVDMFSNFVLKQNNLKIVNLPTDFIDTNYCDKSFIWSGESFRKNANLVNASTKNTKFINSLTVYK